MVNKKKLLKMIARVKTPFYLYDSDVIKRQYGSLRRNIPGIIDIFYAIKANPNGKVVSALSRSGAGADVASAGEMVKAMKSGIKPVNISFAGPGKSKEELKFAVKMNIASISIESPQEIDVLAGISRSLNRRTAVSVRVNPAKGTLGAAIRMGGGSQQFGIDEEAVRGAIMAIKSCKYLDFTGIHMHTGSQILSERTIADNMAFLLDYCLRLKDTAGAEMKLVNFGGGLGIPYYEGQKSLDARLLGGMVNDIFNSKLVKSNFKNTRFVIEPGRFLVGEAGAYVTKVLYRKVSCGKTFLIVDGGMHHNLAAAGLLGEGLRRNRIIGVIGKPESTKKETVTIAGCLCTPLDIFAHDVEIQRLEPGNYLFVTCSGAYGYSASPLLFLSHVLPAEVTI